MRTEDEQPIAADRRPRNKPSLGFIVLAVAVAAAIIVSSFALAHVLIGEAFRKLAG